MARLGRTIPQRLVTVGAPPVVPAPVSTLVDTFSGTLGLWSASFGSPSIVAGRGRIPNTTGFTGLRTPFQYTLQGSSVSAQVYLPVATGATSQSNVSLMVGTTTVGTQLRIKGDAFTGLLTFSNEVGSTDANAVSITYDPVAHAWWRIRESGGTIFWETSPDSVTWTNQRTTNATAPAYATNGTLLSVLFQTHRDAGTSDYAEVDNVNVTVIAQPAAVTITGTVAAAGTLAAAGAAVVTATAAVTAGGTVATGAATALGFTSTITPAGSGSSSPAVSAAMSLSAAGAVATSTTVNVPVTGTVSTAGSSTSAPVISATATVATTATMAASGSAAVAGTFAIATTGALGGPIAAPAWKVDGASTSATAAVTAVNPVVPAAAGVGDLSVLAVSAKPYSTVIDTPSGWTKIGEATNGTAASTPDAGSTKIALYVLESAVGGSSVGNIGQTGANSMSASISTFSRDPRVVWDYSASTSGGDATDGANLSAVGSQIDLVAQDFIVTAAALDSDAGAVTAADFGALTGTTHATIDLRKDRPVTTGDDTRLMMWSTKIFTGIAQVPPELNFTNASPTSGAVMWLRLRTVDPNTLTKTATVTVTGGITATGRPAGVTSVSATATITSAGAVATSTDTSVPVTAAVTAVGLAGSPNGILISFTSAVTSAGGVATFGLAAIPGTAAIAVTGSANLTGTAAVPVTAAIAATGTVAVSSGASILVTATITAGPTGGLASTATVSLTGTTTAAGTLGTQTAVAVTPTVTVSTIGVRGFTGSAAVTASFALTTAAQLATSTGAAVASVAGVTAAGALGLTGATLTLTSSAAVVASGAAGLATDSTLAIAFGVTASGAVAVSTGHPRGTFVTIISAGVVGVLSGSAVTVGLDISTTSTAHMPQPVGVGFVGEVFADGYVSVSSAGYIRHSVRIGGPRDEIADGALTPRRGGIRYGGPRDETAGTGVVSTRRPGIRAGGPHGASRGR